VKQALLLSAQASASPTKFESRTAAREHASLAQQGQHPTSFCVGFQGFRQEKRAPRALGCHALEGYLAPRVGIKLAFQRIEKKGKIFQEKFIPHSIPHVSRPVGGGGGEHQAGDRSPAGCCKPLSAPQGQAVAVGSISRAIEAPTGCSKPLSAPQGQAVAVGSISRAIEAPPEAASPYPPPWPGGGGGEHQPGDRSPTGCSKPLSAPRARRWRWGASAGRSKPPGCCKPVSAPPGPGATAP
jgi:hypothetical protein